MKRRISYLISTLFLSGVLAVVLRSVDFSSPMRPLSTLLPAVDPAVPAAGAPSLQRSAPTEVEPLSPQVVVPATAPESVRLKATPLREVRVRAARDGRDYGWVQLPRGTKVRLLRDEGETLLIRFDQVTLRIPRVLADTGMVVPVAHDNKKLAGL